MAKGVWGFLKKVGLAEEVSGAQAEAVAEEQEAPAKTPVQASQETAEEKARRADIDKMVRSQLVDSMESAGAPLIEELNDLLETLGESIPDEKLRYSTALKIIIKKGGSVSAICNDIDKCIGVLEQKDREFNKTLKDQFDKRVGANVSSAENCAIAVKEKKDQIAALQDEVTALEKERAESLSQVIEEQEKLDLVKDRFTIAYHAIQAQVESLREKVMQYGEGS